MSQFNDDLQQQRLNEEEVIASSIIEKLVEAIKPLKVSGIPISNLDSRLFKAMKQAEEYLKNTRNFKEG